jgi:hypothetical protein
MDTLKEKQLFDEMYASGHMPWAAWEQARSQVPAAARLAMAGRDSGNGRHPL